MPEDKTLKGSGHVYAFPEDRQLLEDIARQAGQLALRYFNRDPEVWTKGNNSPVTEADIAVDRFLKKVLLEARPEYGWLSEESEDDKIRLDKQRVFVVDPIDGTRAFIDGGSEWTISLAIVEDHRPVAGVLFAPVRGEMYTASRFGGATLNGVKLTCPRLASLDGARAAGPRPAIAKGPLARAGVRNAGYIRSLAYRIVMVTTGALDLALAREGAHDWDIAAADLIVEEAEGVLRDKSNRVLRYNRASVKHDSLYASCRALGRLAAPCMPTLHFPQRR
ncbi:3'(2'),5'-bisphosphate nucleotidase CysQ [uncultured Cohaesibacter sp.]|uniref:3'(2'),5'-bisphosphate nucleotidase CysQ n=1 Tax=uncultured Cohaesibacter sp. TaxID=1002546 RepID=UPI00292FFE01|nr:3'(2'),5'-bisphosphate nucleotidase CysQ [uncultured Cohaesibacter sp.]